MAVVRHDILTDAATRKAFGIGVNRLKQDHAAGITTQTLGFSGQPVPVSTYDAFVLWHYIAMNTMTPRSPNPRGRNSAHRGSIFLPWHRFMLLLFEQHLQRVLQDPSFGLPYWDWAADGDQPQSAQRRSALWKATGIGGDGNVSTGPFAFKANDPTSFRVFFAEDTVTGRLTLVSSGRALARQLGLGLATLPTSADVTHALRPQRKYDVPDWDVASDGFRNELEGWPLVGGGAFLHNRVHVWVGGDMGPGTSPNDPVFYLNHCNVDRVWEAWMQRYGRSYLPIATSPGAPVGHRLTDTITSLVTTTTTTPKDMLNVGSLYSYDVLPAIP